VYTIVKLFDVQNRDLEIGIGSLKISEMAPFDVAYTSSYSSSIVTMAVKLVPFSKLSEIFVEIGQFSYSLYLTYTIL